jgi:hypothetical protein
MTRIIKQHVRQIPRRLVKPRGLPVVHPFLAGGPRTRTGGVFKTGAVLPGHTVDEFFGAEVVADEVFVAGEEEDWEVV